jgi:hypothetical protein
MVIVEIEPEEVIAECRTILRLPAGGRVDDDVFLAAMLRRSAGTLCPCSPVTLRAALLESLQHLGSEETLEARIDAVIEGLVIVGDLLELSDVVTEGASVKETWIFAAPPSFIVRPNGKVFLAGVVRDQDTFLPHSLASRITYEAFARIIVPRAGEDLPGELRDQGLRQLPDTVWLKRPRNMPARDLLASMRRQLGLQLSCGTVRELQILDSTRPVTYYRGRWKTPTDQSGTFIARRPQDYGAPIWCLAALEHGVPVKLLDLPQKRNRWRGCDAAWHVQMAIDYCRGQPQVYRSRRVDGDVRLDFFSPLPQWSQRRLIVFGIPVPCEKSLFSFRLPHSEAETEQRFLQNNLWLAPEEDFNERHKT